MKISPSRRLRLAGLLFLLLLLLVAACWTYLLKPQSAPPRDWLVVTAEPVFGWQRNATGAPVPTVAVEASNCGPAEIAVSVSGQCFWDIPTSSINGQTNYSGQFASYRGLPP
jgi:hypothetical protein